MPITGQRRRRIAHYTRYLAQHLGPFGITANCIAPGVIATGRIMATVIPGSIQGNQDRTELVALRRLGTVEDRAKVVEFLATDLSDYVTGAVIPGWWSGARIGYVGPYTGNIHWAYTGLDSMPPVRH